VVGVDLSEAMLAVARRIRPDLRWVRGDAGTLPLRDDDADVAVSQMAMMFFPDPVAALRELRRVVRPTGAVGVLVPGALATNKPYDIFVDIVTHHAGASARSLVTAYFSLGDLGRLRSLFVEAGLRVESAGPVAGEGGAGSIDELVTVEIDSTPLGERLDPGARTRIHADCREALAPWVVEGGALRFPFESTLVVARP
jgi:SAM-dependent methyltransferase